MNNEELIGIVLKVLQLQEQSTSSKKIHLLEGIIKGHTEVMDTLWIKMNKLEVHFGNMNIRINNLEKRVFEVPSPTEAASSKEPSERSKAQTGVTRGPYKKRTKALPKNVQNVVKVIADQVVQNDLGTKTITKYLTKINNVLNHSKNFSKAVILAELRDKVSGPQLAKLGGRDTLKEVKKAKWRLDARRRRDLKIGIYGKKNYWRKRTVNKSKTTAL